MAQSWRLKTHTNTETHRNAQKHTEKHRHTDTRTRTGDFAVRGFVFFFLDEDEAALYQKTQQAFTAERVDFENYCDIGRSLPREVKVLEGC